MLHIPVAHDRLFFAGLVHAADLRAFQGISLLNQAEQIALNGFSVGIHAVFIFQDPDDILLAQWMLRIRMLSQNIKNMENQQVLGL